MWWPYGANLREKRYVISTRARIAIENELRRFPDMETGGFLLGYSDESYGVYILEATDGGYQNVLHEPCCFQYDNAYIEHVCTILSEIYTPQLDVVGIWHKHNQTSSFMFSCADENLHMKLVEQFAHSCLSILFEKMSDEEEGQIQYDMRVFELNRYKHVDISGLVEW